MPQATRLLPDTASDAAIRADIRHRPIVLRIAEVVAHWEERSYQVMQRGDWNLAAICEERAATAAHRLGLLEDALFIHLRHGAETHLFEEIDSYI